jgi:hypothetical protein
MSERKSGFGASRGCGLKREKISKDDSKEHAMSDTEIEFREENERQVAMMIVDALWQFKWIRIALEMYEYHGKGFDGVRQIFGRTPPDSERPSMQAVKWKLEEFVLSALREHQCEIHSHKKKNKRSVTAADLFKPNRRLMNTYGVNVREVSLTRGAWKIFENNARGQAEFERYCLENNVDPKDVVELDSA